MFKTQLFISAFTLLAPFTIQASQTQTEPQQKMVPHDFVLSLREEDLNPAIENSPCLILDVYADWCRPCKLLQPILTHLSFIHKDKCVFAKIDGFRNPMPTQHLFSLKMARK
jgi:thiol:disulfide interchange protein